VHLNQLGQAEGPPFGLEVQPLAANHALDSPRLKQLGGHSAQYLGGQAELPGRNGQESGSNRDQEKPHAGCGGNIERAVHGRTTSPEIVVVHAGKIVVHQRIGMNRLDCSSHPGYAARASTDGTIGSENQRGTDPLPGGPERIGQCFPVSPAEIGLQVLGPVTEQSLDRLSGLQQQICCLRRRAERGIRHRAW
jgi:hypothetical protein